MGAIDSIKSKCRKCYSCVRNCPVKAIKLDDNGTEIIDSRCIGCGKCVKVCSQGAKVITGNMEGTKAILDKSEEPIAVLGCSFSAFFDTCTPGQLVTAIKKLGFSEVHQGAFGVDLICDTYKSDIEDRSKLPIITSHCPSTVSLIEKHYPSLIDNIAQVVSPMVAIGRFIKESSPKKKIVYMSSCIAGKFEISAEQTKGAIDQVLTYTELSQMFGEKKIDIHRLVSTEFDGISPQKGALFSISGGPFHALDIKNDPFNPDYLCVEGNNETIEIINDLAEKRIAPKVVDVRFCGGGCIGGPGKNNRLTTVSKKSIIINSAKINNSATSDTLLSLEQYPSPPSMKRSFIDLGNPLPTPKAESIQRILQSTNKMSPEDELNCGCCGYHTCKEHAVAVFRGFAEGEMCLPYSLKRMEEDRFSLAQKYELAKRALDQEFGDTMLIGQDSQTLDVMRLIQQVGPTPTTVLIRGESGTGKELTARSIHQSSQRSDKQLVTVNCTTLTDSLLESELFGHKKGSFTGAIADKMGLFQAANGGTIFLDEIGDITPKLQAELLRVIDNSEIKPVGSNTTIKVDVRLIAATNRNLEKGIKEGWFRDDLYYRLNVFTITVPPLKNRTDSIPALVQHFIVYASNKLNKKVNGIDDRALRALLLYHWPGNIRELQNIIERASVLTPDSLIKLDCLPVIFSELLIKEENTYGNFSSSDFQSRRAIQTNEIEKSLIIAYLKESKGNVSQAARRANVPRRTFYRMLERHNIKGLEFKQTSPLVDVRHT